jgi:hypothetical protein
LLRFARNEDFGWLLEFFSSLRSPAFTSARVPVLPNFATPAQAAQKTMKKQSIISI